ncbi:futalosine hydrolase [Thermoactinomyces sp. DSM 45892]|uniref:futalosine hydrolase n=1 Tax=Thermoactinomyces sp. DSM 45892 TaxID=1882753 RepID=UPI000894D4DC|nr:futalosine hydrolase [Thermoactinomyces sp. DSM 45892]SDY76034.1 futalosine hydrolase [Thermoactinomyces sp. DSM 45892]
MGTSRVLVVTAVELERKAVLRGLGQENGRVKVIAAGVGPVTSAVQTTLELVKNQKPYDLVIIAGVAGGFVGRADVGHIVVASQIRSGDLGAESLKGFISIDELGFGSGAVEVDEKMTKRIYQTLIQAGAPVSIGPILTMNTTTGTKETAKRLIANYPEARAEAMEGFGIATAAQKMNIPVCEIRTISNLVGPRDRDAWKLEDALLRLEEAFAKCKEVL